MTKADRPFVVRDQFVPYSPPDVGNDEAAAVVAVLKSPWLTTGPEVARLEQEFCERFGASAALALNSCTAGLHVALIAHGIAPGDEVIVPTHTFCATANVVEHVGARPRLVDVEADTLNIDPACVRDAIGPRTKAIMPVHYAGHPVDLRAVRAIAKEHGLAVIEDAAHAVGASFQGQPIGADANLASFSFYATKNMTTAEGGMLTGPAPLIEQARTIALHGMDRDAFRRYEKGGTWRYDVVTPGFKYNMPDVLAAIGRVQLRRLDAMQAQRKRLVSIYQDRLKDVPGIELPSVRHDVESSWHLYVIRVGPEAGRDRDELVEALGRRNVGVSVHYTPVHMHSYYATKYGYRPDDLPVAARAFREILSLPLSQGHGDGDIEYVCAALLDALREA